MKAGRISVSQQEFERQFKALGVRVGQLSHKYHPPAYPVIMGMVLKDHPGETFDDVKGIFEKELDEASAKRLGRKPQRASSSSCLASKAVVVNVGQHNMSFCPIPDDQSEQVRLSICRIIIFPLKAARYSFGDTSLMYSHSCIFIYIRIDQHRRHLVI